MKEIGLTQGLVALVDDDDYGVISGLKWYAALEGKNKNYPDRYVARANIGYRKIYMHRLIMQAEMGVLVDHINHDGLDNRKSNLRLCTSRDNSRNTRGCGAKSGFKGVHLHTKTGLWRARIKVNKKEILIGYYATKNMAAKAYNNAAVELFGEFACLNEVPSGY